MQHWFDLLFIAVQEVSRENGRCCRKRWSWHPDANCGAEGDRTPDLLVAKCPIREVSRAMRCGSRGLDTRCKIRPLCTLRRDHKFSMLRERTAKGHLHYSRCRSLAQANVGEADWLVSNHRERDASDGSSLTRATRRAARAL